MILESSIWAFSSTGLATTAYASIKIFNFFRLHFLRSTSLSRYQHQPNAWALITGASDGIGYAFAEELCQRGFNIILHGRNPEKLNNVKTNLNRLFPTIKIRIFIDDATKDSLAPITDLVASIQDLPLTILINNVGGTKGLVSPAFKTFESTSASEIDALCKANERFPTMLTNALLPTLSRHRHRPSLILNVGSTSCGGAPYLSVYAATKAYIAAWSVALKVELAAESRGNIEVLGILVGSTQSGQNEAPTSFFHQSSRRLARDALRKVGCGKAVVTANWRHHLQKAFLDALPEWAARVMLVGVLKRLKDQQLKDM